MIDGEGKPIPPGSWGGDLDPMRGSACATCGVPIPFGKFCPTHQSAARDKNEQIAAERRAAQLEERVEEPPRELAPEHALRPLPPQRFWSKPDSAPSRSAGQDKNALLITQAQVSLSALRMLAEDGQIPGDLALEIMQSAAELTYALAGTLRGPR